MVLFLFYKIIASCTDFFKYNMYEIYENYYFNKQFTFLKTPCTNK